MLIGNQNQICLLAENVPRDPSERPIHHNGKIFIERWSSEQNFRIAQNEADVHDAALENGQNKGPWRSSVSQIGPSLCQEGINTARKRPAIPSHLPGMT